MVWLRSYDVGAEEDPREEGKMEEVLALFPILQGWERAGSEPSGERSKATCWVTQGAAPSPSGSQSPLLGTTGPLNPRGLLGRASGAAEGWEKVRSPSLGLPPFDLSQTIFLSGKLLCNTEAQVGAL